MKSMKSILRTIAVAIVVCLLPISASAQTSAADIQFSKGLQSQRNMTIAAQNQAINFFTKAKALFDSPARKTQCDNAIAVSQGIKKYITDHQNQPKVIQQVIVEQPKAQTEQPRAEQPKASQPSRVRNDYYLRVDNEYVNLDMPPKTFRITVNTNMDSWDVTPLIPDDGESFVTVEKVGNNEFEVHVPANIDTRSRTQKIEVLAGNMVKDVVITQSGRGSR